MASQSGSYAALLAGGVLAVAGFSGHSIRDVLAGRSSPLRGLVSEPPPPGGSSLETALGALIHKGGSGANGPFSTESFGTAGAGAGKAVEWAKSVLGVSGGSGKVARWDAAIGMPPGIPWCSAFVSAALRNAGIKHLPPDPAYSGSWLNWKGGIHIPNFSEAQPGDLLIFDWGDGGRTDHVALYAGNGKMISGNDINDSVGESSVPVGNLVGIVRPKYPNSRVTSGFSGKRVRGFKVMSA